MAQSVQPSETSVVRYRQANELSAQATNLRLVLTYHFGREECSLPRRQTPVRSFGGVQKRVGVPGDHQLFVCFHHANGDRTSFRRDDGGTFGVPIGVDMDTEKLQILANPSADRRLRFRRSPP